MSKHGTLAALSWVLRIQDSAVGDAALRTLAVLADYMGEDYQCYPRATTLAEDRGVDRATIYRHLRRLEEHGYISPGDQRLVAHLKGDDRPRVWRINVFMRKAEEPVEDLLGGVANLRHLDAGGVATVATGGVATVATTDIGRTPIRTSDTQVVRNSRAGARGHGRRSAFIEYPGAECVHGIECVLIDSKQGRVWKCPECRARGACVPAPPERPLTDAELAEIEAFRESIRQRGQKVRHAS